MGCQNNDFKNYKLNNFNFLVSGLLFAILLPVSNVSLQAQKNSVSSSYQAFDNSYGLEPQLVNGRRYFRTNLHAEGHPFYHSEETFAAKVCVNGVCYPNTQLLYELNKGEFILAFHDNNDVPGFIILNKELIDSVVTGQVKFIQNPFNEIDNSFLQIIHDDSISAYASYYKEYIFQNVGAQTGYKYGETSISYYIEVAGKLQSVNSKRGLVRAFHKTNRKALNAYLTERKIKFKKITWQEIKTIVEFCNSELQ